MKARFVGVSLGVIIFLVLSIAVIQRMSAEAMAVFVGVVAGVVASIPTSLIVVWFALRTAYVRTESANLNRTMAEARPAEPRIVVVSPSVMPAPSGYGPLAPLPLSPYAQSAPRRFTVIGGSAGMAGELLESEEAVWRP
jgi:hypothetical protein